MRVKLLKIFSANCIAEMGLNRFCSIIVLMLYIDLKAEQLVIGGIPAYNEQRCVYGSTILT